MTEQELEREYNVLFQTIQRIVEADPEQVPQLFTVLLAGAPFRPFLERPELLNRALSEARKLVAETSAPEPVKKI